MRRRAADRKRSTRPGSSASTVSGLGVTALAATALLLVPSGAAAAEPKPSRKQLTAQQEKLSDQAERLTEQYHGLHIRLQQAQRAAKLAQDNAARQQRTLEEVRGRVARLAADAYRTGGDDPVSTFVASDDSQATLDRVATVDYFARQNGAQVDQLLQAMQEAERARKQADSRSAQVRELAKANKKKQQEVNTLLAKVERKLGVTTGPGVAGPGVAGPAPNVPAGGASAKAMAAVKAAMAVRGTAYSYGGGTASGPSFGIAQGSGIKGFDCSGLTLYAYAQVGISLPHYTGDQFNAGTHVSQSQLRPGDLVFFYSDLHHMGMYIGNGNMIHAPQTGDVVKISPMSGRPFAGGVRLA